MQNTSRASGGPGRGTVPVAGQRTSCARADPGTRCSARGPRAPAGNGTRGRGRRPRGRRRSRSRRSTPRSPRGFAAFAHSRSTAAGSSRTSRRPSTQRVWPRSRSSASAGSSSRTAPRGSLSTKKRSGSKERSAARIVLPRSSMISWRVMSQAARLVMTVRLLAQRRQGQTVGAGRELERGRPAARRRSTARSARSGEQRQLLRDQQIAAHVAEPHGVVRIQRDARPPPVEAQGSDRAAGETPDSTARRGPTGMVSRAPSPMRHRRRLRREVPTR